MPITNPSLDDKSFQELVEEARKKIPVYLSTWTDHNISDPGITFIELFAWLAEMQLYTLNKITDKNRLKFLKLLGVSVQQAILPKLDVAFLSKQETPIVISKNSTLESYTELGQTLIFETDEEINIVPLKIGKIGTINRKGFEDVTTSVIVQNRGYFYAFGDEPMPGSSLYIGFDTTLLTNNIITSNLFGQLVTISLYAYEEDLIPLANHGSENPDVFLLNKVVWEYLSINDDDDDRTQVTMSWRSLKVIQDSTDALTKSGRVSFTFPFKEHDRTTVGFFASDNITSSSNSNNNNINLFWIRCKLVESNYEIPPRINTIIINTVSATYNGESTTESKEVDLQIDALSDSVFEINESKRSLLIKVNKVRVYYSETQKVGEQEVAEEQDRRVLFFLNNARSAEEIADAIRLKEYDSGLRIGLQILQARKVLGGFASLDEIKDIPTIDRETFVIIVDALKDREIPWTEVDDFDASGPEDHHYTVDNSRGVINFGNGIQGRRPPIGSKIEVTYKFGDVENVYARPQTIFTVFDKSGSAIQDSLEIINHFPSTRGKKKDSLRETIIRARRELKIPFKAVTASDFEYIAVNTPGLRVARAKAFTLSQLSDNNVIKENRRKEEENDDDNNNKEQEVRDDNTVNVIVVPYIPPKTPIKSPIPSKGFLHTVCKHLDKHRLITTKIKVTSPKYVGISVDTTITINSSTDPKYVKERIAEALDEFLNPISRKPGQYAWPFGRDVYMSEVYATIEKVEGVECVLQVVLSGSGRSQDFKNKEGNVKVNNMCLVYLKSYSVNVLPSISGQCRSGVVGGGGGGGKGIGEDSSRQEKNWK